MEGHGQKLDLVHITVIATFTHHFSVVINTPVTTDIQNTIVTQVETLSRYNAVHHKVIKKYHIRESLYRFDEPFSFK